MNSPNQTLDINQIKTYLPHRYPLLLVDRVLNWESGKSITAIKNVTINEPQFMGHFPGNPVFPGVLMIEGMAQTAGVICILAEAMAEKKSVYFLTIEHAKFRKLVLPGYTLEYHMTKKAHKKNMWWYRGEARVADQVVAEAVVGAMVVGE